jgi:glucose/arabinose dehydrogenase/cytochrome c2
VRYLIRISGPILLTLLVGWCIGIVSEKKGLVSSARIRGWIARARDHLSDRKSTPRNHDVVGLDTILLPLKVETVDLFAEVNIAGHAGGITVIANSVIVVDRNGAGFVYKEGKSQALKLPPLPNEAAAYVNSGRHIDEQFRVHDVEYIPWLRLLAVSHEAYDPAGGGTRLTLSVIAFDPDALTAQGSWRAVWKGDLLRGEDYRGLAGGGRMLAAAPNSFYLTAGDYTQDNAIHRSPLVAQDKTLSFGKILRIDPQTGAAEVVSLGHRNPQGIALTRSGELISTEHGPEGGDELNVIRTGANYGWPKVTYGTHYGTYDWPNTSEVGRHAGFALPLFSWVPSVAISNLIELCDFDQRWHGDLLAGSLKAGALFRIRREEGRVMYVEPIPIGERIRDLAQMDKGRIVLFTDSSKLLILSVDHSRLSSGLREAIVYPSVMTQCMACHHFGPTFSYHPAPTLSALVGNPIASDRFSQYSNGIKAVGGVWTKERLQRYLSDPASFAPGTRMPKPNLKPSDTLEVVSFLETLRSR